MSPKPVYKVPVRFGLASCFYVFSEYYAGRSKPQGSRGLHVSAFTLTVAYRTIKVDYNMDKWLLKVH